MWPASPCRSQRKPKCRAASAGRVWPGRQHRRSARRRFERPRAWWLRVQHLRARAAATSPPALRPLPARAQAKARSAAATAALAIPGARASAAAPARQDRTAPRGAAAAVPRAPAASRDLRPARPAHPGLYLSQVSAGGSTASTMTLSSPSRRSHSRTISRTPDQSQRNASAWSHSFAESVPRTYSAASASWSSSYMLLTHAAS